MIDTVEKKRATVADIASQAGVTRSTVYMVFGNKYGVSQATRDRVMEVAREMKMTLCFIFVWVDITGAVDPKVFWPDTSAIPFGRYSTHLIKVFHDRWARYRDFRRRSRKAAQDCRRILRIKIRINK